MTPTPRFSIFSSAVRALQGSWEVEVSEKGSVALPAEARWGLALNPGDLLPCEPQPGLLRFRSYAWIVCRCVETVSHPWQYIEELLRQPMAAVGPGGMELSEELLAALDARPGDRLRLRAAVEHGHRWPTLERRERPGPTNLWLLAKYFLVVQPGPMVLLPEELRWALGLREGDLLFFDLKLETISFDAYERLLHRLAETGSRWRDVEAVRRRPAEAMGSDGSVLLPSPLAAAARLQPGIRAELTTEIGEYVDASLSLRRSVDL